MIFKEYSVTNDVINLAKNYESLTFNKKDKILNCCTFHNGEKLPAFIAEAVFKKTHPEFLRVGCFDHDFIFNDITVDVKAKLRNYEPRHFFSATVPSYQINNQNCKYYCFYSLTKENEKYRIWMCGKISKRMFIKKAKIWKAGSVDKSNGLKWKTDTYEIKYSELQVGNSKK